MNKRSLILCGLALLFIIAAFASLFYDNKQTVNEYEDFLNGEGEQPKTKKTKLIPVPDKENLKSAPNVPGDAEIKN